MTDEETSGHCIIDTPELGTTTHTAEVSVPRSQSVAPRYLRWRRILLHLCERDIWDLNTLHLIFAGEVIGIAHYPWEELVLRSLDVAKAEPVEGDEELRCYFICSGAEAQLDQFAHESS